MSKQSFLLMLFLTLVIFSFSFSMTSLYAAERTIPGSRPTPPPDLSDVKDPVTLPGGATAYATQTELQSLGSVWQVAECCGWSGTWTRRPGTNTFDAKWKHTNGTTAQDVITLIAWNKSTGKVTLKRHALNGEYTGILNVQTRSISQGTASWYKAGDSWSARY